MTTDVSRRTVRVGAFETSFLEAGSGPAVLLLHGGEFGASAAGSWERLIGPLAQRYRVVAPDLLGFGRTAKVVDFVDSRAMRIRHVADLCDLLSIDDAVIIGNSMGGVMALNDAASGAPRLPAVRIVSICGGGEILRNAHVDALFEYDGSLPAMRRLVAALFHDPAYADDEDVVGSRYEASVAPGAWEAVAAARFRRPHPHEKAVKPEPEYERITVPTLILEGEFDKLKPRGWAHELAQRIPLGQSSIIADSGHCPQIEQRDLVLAALAGFIEDPRDDRENSRSRSADTTTIKGYDE